MAVINEARQSPMRWSVFVFVRKTDNLFYAAVAYVAAKPPAIVSLIFYYANSHDVTPLSCC